jgi:hypothetical protein
MAKASPELLAAAQYHGRSSAKRAEAAHREALRRRAASAGRRRIAIDSRADRWWHNSPDFAVRSPPAIVDARVWTNKNRESAEPS